MSHRYSEIQYASAHEASVYGVMPAYESRVELDHARTPISQQVLTWLLFWPLLTLIARQSVYFDGPARDALAYQNGTARGSHIYFYINMLFLLGFALAGYRKIWSVLQGNPLILASLVLAAASALWSAAPIFTLQMSVEVALSTLFACYLSTRMSTERLITLLMFMGVAASLLSIFFALALPRYGIFAGYGGGAWQGISNHKNTLGISMAFLLTPVFFTTQYRRKQRLLYGALVLFLIAMSQSKGAWLDTAGMLLFVGWLSLIRRFRINESILLLVGTSTIAVAAIVFGVTHASSLTTLMGKDATMSGRTGIYAEVWRSIIKHPLLGYGFGAFWGGVNPESRRIGLSLRWMNIGYSENGFLEVMLQLGVVGLGLILAMIVRAVVQAVRLLRSPFYIPQVGWFLTIIFLVLLTNIDAGWFMTSDTLDWVLILIAFIGLRDQTRRMAAPQRPLKMSD